VARRLRPNVLPAQQACPGYRPRLSTRPSRSCHALLSLLPSWPALCRPSTSVNRSADKTWIPGTRPGMTTRDKPGMTTEPGCQTREDDAQDRGGDDADQDRLVALLTDSLELQLL
jgi:hypothetical protein